MKVQYGCGLSAPTSWRNFDASPTLRLQRLPGIGRIFRRPPYPVFPSNVEYGDIVKGLPIRDGSCSALYCSHVLEHLALADLRAALRNSLRYLAPGGVFRLVVPDLELLARRYLESASAGASAAFMMAAHLGRTERPRGIAAGVRTWLGNSAHLWMWDYKGLAQELKRAGFASVRRATFGDAADFGFAAVEDEARWADCLGMEASS